MQKLKDMYSRPYVDHEAIHAEVNLLIESASIVGCISLPKGTKDEEGYSAISIKILELLVLLGVKAQKDVKNISQYLPNYVVCSPDIANISNYIGGTVEIYQDIKLEPGIIVVGNSPTNCGRIKVFWKEKWSDPLAFFYGNSFYPDEISEKSPGKADCNRFTLLHKNIVPGTVTGVVCLGETNIQTFAQEEHGEFVITNIGEPEIYVKDIFLNHLTGDLYLAWNQNPGEHFVKTTYETERE